MIRVHSLPGALACALVVISSCGRSEPASGPSSSAAVDPRSSLRETMPPVMSGVEPSLQERIRAAYASLTSARTARTTSDVELGRAYGQVGKLLLAAELYDQAEPHLLNARALDPGELAWPYYLAHAYRLRHHAGPGHRVFRGRPSDSSPTTCPRWSGSGPCMPMAAAPISRSRCSRRPCRSTRGRRRRSSNWGRPRSRRGIRLVR